MSLLKTKQIAGPSSGHTGSVILFEGGKASWSSDLNSAIKLPSGPTSSRPEDAQGGHIRYNETTGRIEAFEAGNWKNVITDSEILRRFSVRLGFDISGNFISVDTLPNGWTVTAQTGVSFTLSTNVNKSPFTFQILGQTGSGSTRYQTRPQTQSVEMEIDANDPNLIYLGGLSAFAAGAPSNGFATVWFMF